MLTNEQLRATDPRLAEVSDEELREARELLYQLARLVVEMKRGKRRKGSNFSSGSLKDGTDLE